MRTPLREISNSQLSVAQQGIIFQNAKIYDSSYGERLGTRKIDTAVYCLLYFRPRISIAILKFNLRLAKQA
jgi:hypothetical protein